MAKFNIKAQAIPTVASAYADVIGTTDNQIIEINNELIIEDNKQKFQIHEDTIEQLAERIAQDGQLSPCIVSPLPDGRYELIDGRHRRRAVIKAGLPTTKCIIKTDLTDKQKKTIQLTSNLIRNNDYLPSELAFAYKELAELEDMKTISEETNLSKKKIYRYIRLTNLIEPLLNRVDSGTIPVIAAVELSYLTEQQQNQLFTFLLNHSGCKITTTNAREIREQPDNLYDVFYPSNGMDNLSTEEETSVSSEPEKAPEDNHQKVDNLSTDTENSNKDSNVFMASQINEHIQNIISQYVIDETEIDYYILRYAYDKNDVLEHFKEFKHRGSVCPGITINGETFKRFSCEWNVMGMFRVIIDGKTYLLSYKDLEGTVRQYIRNNYDVKRIVALVSKPKKNK